MPPKTSAQTPVRSPSQRMEALQKANAIRSQRAQLKKELKIDLADTTVSVYVVPDFFVFDAERFKRTVAQRMLRYRRFRQIATLDSEGAWWVDDPDFDIDAHVRHSVLPAPCGKKELQKFVAEMASTPLNPARPRWEFNLPGDEVFGSRVVADDGRRGLLGVVLPAGVLVALDADRLGSEQLSLIHI